MNLTPSKMFFTKGSGIHKNKLQSFELALREAGIEKCNLVSVSSIFPPNCEIISKAEGIKLLHPGQITFLVIARECTNEPNRLVTTAIGLACPKNKNQYGYISEHHTFGQTKKKAEDFAEDLAATMLASTLGIELNPDTAWNERKKLYISKGRQFQSTSIAQTAQGNKTGLWTTAISCAVMIMPNEA